MKRLDFIDDIRGISIFAMIMIHTNVYFLQNNIAYTLIELSQFAVVAFIFCSSYLYYLKDKVETLPLFWQHFLKRLKRLIIPYYIFLAVYFLFTFLKEPQKLTPNYIFQNLTLTGGIDFSWLVILFIELTILMPFFSFLRRKYSIVLYMYIIVAVISSIIFLKYTPLPWYRFIMWLPWSLIIIYTMYFEKIRKNTFLFWGLTLGFFAIFLVTQQFVLVPLGHSLRMYDNKYPPNIYHLSYCLAGLNILYFLSQKGLFAVTRRFIHFLSRYSYEIFFIHILVIFVVTVFFHFPFNWVTFFLAVLGITSLVQVALNYFLSTL
ncbi:acyltransferase [Candidatus Roizmanbacteria bacterium]|nr:acyltransferase [Candidatus Roizmanbacteria bacterium]